MTTVRDNSDRENDSLAELLEIDAAKRRLLLHTSMPGHIVSYDAATQRATVQPALMIVRKGERAVHRPPIVDAPVFHPAGGGFISHFPLIKGDPVWLVFSERGIQTWKQNIAGEAMPDRGHFFNEGDAVVFHGLRPSASPEITDGISIQTDDGTTRITIQDGRVIVNAENVEIQGATQIVINGGNVVITGNTTINGNQAANAPAGTGSAAGHSHSLTAL